MIFCIKKECRMANHSERRPLDEFEPSTFRLTAERANLLRHRHTS